MTRSVSSPRHALLVPLSPLVVYSEHSYIAAATAAAVNAAVTGATVSDTATDAAGDVTAADATTAPLAPI